MQRDKYLWITDPHILFPWQRYGTLAKIKREEPKGILFTGDISNGVMLMPVLKMFAQLGIPCYMVLGNHEYFWSSRDKIHAKMRKLCEKYPYMVWLEEQEEPVRLDEEICLIGTGGWFDGAQGDTKWLNWKADWWIIKEFRKLGSLEKKLEFSRQLAQESCEKVERRLRKAIEQDYKTIYLLSHIPPWIEATRDQGTIMERYWLPYNTNIRLGETIEKVMADYKKRRVVVLSGHTHHPIYIRVSRNIECQVGASNYLGVLHSQKIYL